MFAKVCVLVVSLGLCACALLALRQQRIQAAHELAEARLRVLQRDNELWRARARIAERVTPEHIQELANRINPLKPIGADGAQTSALTSPLNPPEHNP